MTDVKDFFFNSNQQSIRKVNQQKNLGIIFDEHLNLNSHHIQTLKSCYGILHSLSHLKKSLSKQNKTILINNLIFSKMYHGNVITHSLNSYWTKKYNSLFKTCLSFIHGKYIHSSDMNHCNILNPYHTWLHSILTLTFKAIFHSNSPLHLQLNLQTPSAFNLRSDGCNRLPTVLLDKSFNSTASTLFNALPDSIRINASSQGAKQFSNTIKKILLTTQSDYLAAPPAAAFSRAFPP